MDHQTVLGRRRLHRGVAEEPIIGLGREDRLSVVTPLNDVLRLSGYKVAANAGHGAPAMLGSLANDRHGVQHENEYRDTIGPARSVGENRELGIDRQQTAQA